MHDSVLGMGARAALSQDTFVNYSTVIVYRDIEPRLTVRYASGFRGIPALPWTSNYGLRVRAFVIFFISNL
jgi:hypothetical protein